MVVRRLRIHASAQRHNHRVRLDYAIKDTGLAGPTCFQLGAICATATAKIQLPKTMTKPLTLNPAAVLIGNVDCYKQLC